VTILVELTSKSNIVKNMISTFLNTIQPLQLASKVDHFIT